MTPTLYATPLSHFARKVRIVLAELERPHELVFVPNLLSSDPEDFGGNPVLRIPTWRDGETWLIESDEISRHLVREHDPADRLRVLDLSPEERNVLSITNAAMGAEVEILLSRRSGIESIEDSPYFQRWFDTMRHCLGWLDRQVPAVLRGDEPCYLDIALSCMWDHVNHYGTIEGLDEHRNIAERVARFAERPSVAESAPANAGTT